LAQQSLFPLAAIGKTQLQHRMRESRTNVW